MGCQNLGELNFTEQLTFYNLAFTRAWVFCIPGTCSVIDISLKIIKIEKCCA